MSGSRQIKIKLYTVKKSTQNAIHLGELYYIVTKTDIPQQNTYIYIYMHTKYTTMVDIKAPLTAHSYVYIYLCQTMQYVDLCIRK